VEGSVLCIELVTWISAPLANTPKQKTPELHTNQADGHFPHS